MIRCLIEHRIAYPGLDRRFPPAGATGADPNILGKGAVLHLPIEGRAAEAGAVEDGVEAEDAVGGTGLHWYHLAWSAVWWRSPGKVGQNVSWRKGPLWGP